jgi:hypothetical protein
MFSKCFGDYSARKVDCQLCKYQESCKYSTKNKSEIKKSYAVSFDDISYSEEYASKAEILFDEPESDEKEYSKKDLKELINFFVHKDKYTLETLFEVCKKPRQSIADMAKKRGITRQGMHRKVVEDGARHKEIKKVYKLISPKIEKCINTFEKKKVLKKKGNNWITIKDAVEITGKSKRTVQYYASQNKEDLSKVIFKETKLGQNHYLIEITNLLKKFPKKARKCAKRVIETNNKIIKI